MYVHIYKQYTQNDGIVKRQNLNDLRQRHFNNTSSRRSPVVSSVSALLSTFTALSIASTRILYTVFGERELTEPMTVLPLNCANTDGSGEFFGVAVILYELAPVCPLQRTVMLLEVTVNTDKVMSVKTAQNHIFYSIVIFYEYLKMRETGNYPFKNISCQALTVKSITKVPGLGIILKAFNEIIKTKYSQILLQFPYNKITLFYP